MNGTSACRYIFDIANTEKKLEILYEIQTKKKYNHLVQKKISNLLSACIHFFSSVQPNKIE